MVGKKVTEDEFRLVKSHLERHDVESVALMVGRHIAIITKISACKDYLEYRRIVKAEHPPVKRSLRNDIDDLNRRVDSLEDWRSARQAQLNLGL